MATKSLQHRSKQDHQERNKLADALNTKNLQRRKFTLDDLKGIISKV